jgi:hypothetical protein
VIRTALVPVLLAWGLAAGITLFVYTAVSLADFGDLLAAAARASAPAMWLPAAMLLVTAPQTGVRVAGVLLVANTVRLLFSRRPPGERLRAGRPANQRASLPFYLYSDRQPLLFWSETLPPVLGAFAFQAGLYALWVAYPRSAAACFAFGAAIWTRCSIGRGAYQLRKAPNLPRSALAVLLTLLLAASLSIGQFATDERFADTPGLLETARRVFGRLPDASQPKPEAAKQSATPVFTPTREVGRSGGNGVPGVVLRPEAKPLSRNRLWLRAAATAFSISQPLTIPFTGEYHLYRASSAGLPPGASIFAGTPLDAIYVTTNKTPMETEAYQSFETPISFGNGDTIQVALWTTEVLPVSASMRLETAGGTVDLGTQIFGLTPAREPTVEFALPAPPHRLRVSAIRVVFHRNPSQQDQSTRVAIQGFTLGPRGFSSRM